MDIRQNKKPWAVPVTHWRDLYGPKPKEKRSGYPVEVHRASRLIATRGILRLLQTFWHRRVLIDEESLRNQLNSNPIASARDKETNWRMSRTRNVLMPFIVSVCLMTPHLAFCLIFPLWANNLMNSTQAVVSWNFFSSSSFTGNWLFLSDFCLAVDAQ